MGLLGCRRRRLFFLCVDVAVFGSGRTEPNIGSMADAFDLEFRRMAAISGRNLCRTLA